MAEFESGTGMTEVKTQSASIQGIFPGSPRLRSSGGGMAKKEGQKKKRSPIAAFLGILFSIVIILIVAAGIFFLRLTSDSLPENIVPLEPVTLNDNITLKLPDNVTFTLNSGNANQLLDIARQSINKTLAKANYSGISGLHLTDMYANLGASNGMIYAHLDANVRGIKVTLPLQMRFHLGLEDESAVLYVDYFKIGEVSMPFSVIKAFIDRGNLPPEFSARNSKIYYDLSNVNDIVTEMIVETLPGLINDAIKKDSGLLGKISDVLNVDIGQFLGYAAASAIDINVSNLAVKDGQLWVEGTFLRGAKSE